MADPYALAAILVMMAASWLPRMLPLLLVRKRINSTLVRSFLYYVPYAVLTAMTIPAILYATRSLWSAAAGLLAALVLGWRGRSLLVVALGAAAAVYLAELIPGVLVS
jgi:branched-subunit amino acid transport protein